MSNKEINFLINQIIQDNDGDCFLNEGFYAWHCSPEKDLKKFVSEEEGGKRKGLGSVFGYGVYFELVGADENYAEYGHSTYDDPKTQYKIYSPLNLDKDFIDISKSLQENGMNLDIETFKALLKIKKENGILKKPLTPDDVISSLYEIVGQYYNMCYKLKVSHDKWNLSEDELALIDKASTYFRDMKVYKSFNSKNTKDYTDIKKIYPIFDKIRNATLKMLYYYFQYKMPAGNIVKSPTKSQAMWFNKTFNKRGLIIPTDSAIPTKKQKITHKSRRYI
jgi:hypothetical protein